MIQRIIDLVRRRQVASRLGVPFRRAANFMLPDRITLAGLDVELALPNEHGVKVAFVEILLDDCYLCNTFSKYGGPIKTVLDIGANVGLFGLQARNTFGDAVIHAYEPNPFLQEFLITQAQAANFSHFGEAVGAENGHVTLNFEKESVLTRSVSDSNGKIPQVSFRQTIERLGGKIDFLKMDCEGAEWEIFTDQQSWKTVQNLSMEYHLFGDQTVDMLREIVLSLGFYIHSIREYDGFGLLTASKTPMPSA